MAVGSSALAGMTALNSAARTLAYLPGVRGTPLGEATEQFSEGALTRKVGHTRVPESSDRGRGVVMFYSARLACQR